MSKPSQHSAPSKNRIASRAARIRIRNLAILLVFLVSLVGVPTSNAKAEEITFTGKELLGRPTDTSVTVKIVPDEDISPYYQFGTTSGVYPNSTPTESATGYQLDHWSGACSGSGACQVTMASDLSVNAYFTAAPLGAISYIGDIGTATTKTSGTSLVVNTTAAVAAGDDMIIVYATDPNQNISPIGVTDSAGNTYREVGLALNSGELRTYMFAAYDVNALPAGSSITITASASVTARAAVVSVFRGLADEETIDQISTGENDASPTASSGATATTIQADELLVGGVGTEGPNGDAAGTWQNSFTAGPRLGTTGGTDDTNITAALGWRIVSETGSYTASKTGMTQRDHATIIATFKAEPSEPIPRITITGTPLNAFSSMPGYPSAERTYTVSGSNLTDDITITSPSDFQISLTSGSGFGSALTLTQAAGSVADTTIHVRFNRATVGTSSGSITHTSSGAANRNVPVSGTAATPDFDVLLGRPTDHSVTMNLVPKQDGEVYVEYGTVSGSYPQQTTTYATETAEPLEFVIGGLSANARTYYRLVSRVTGMSEWIESEEYSFITQRATGSTFTFTIASDSHLGQYGGQTADELALYEQTMTNVSNDHPDFHMDLGDSFAMDPSPLGTGMTEAEADAAYYIQRPYLDLIARSAPVFLSLGNHENEEGWNFDDVFTPPDQSLARVGLKYRKLYYPNPIPDGFYTGNVDPLSEAIGGDTNHEDYYAWEWGEALFVVLDPFHYSMTWPNDGGAGYGGEGQDGEVSGDRWDWTLGIEQYLWLKNTLETSDATYKFVFSHHVTGGATPYGRGGIEAAPYFEWGGRNADGTWGWDTERPAAEGWTVPIHQLFVDNGVDAYIHGHDHIYAYETLDGIAYVECPKPDDAGYAWEPYGYGYTEGLYPEGLLIQNSGYLRATVSPSGATFEYVRSYLPGDGPNGQVAHSFTIPAEAPEGHTITATAGANGSISPSGAVTVAEGADQTFTITPATGYHVADVLVDSVSVGAVATYTFEDVSANHTIAANFAINTYTITATAGANGSITPSGAVSVDYGADRAFTITPATGYHVADVLVDSVSIGAVTTYTFEDVSANHTIAASFAINTYTITASAGAGGSIDPSGAVSVDYGADWTFTITPATGYHVADVLVDDVSVGAVATYTFEDVSANHTIAASFAINTYTITATAGAGGSIDPSGAVSVDYGADRAFTITPATGYHVADVLVDSVSVGAVTTYTFEDVQANHTIAASFAINTYTITASAGAGGSIDPSGAVSVDYGADQTFTITPAIGYHVADVLVDDVSVGAVTTYTFEDVQANHTIAASFSEVNHAPQTSSDNYAAEMNTTLNVSALSGVLANDSDPDADPLSAVLLTQPAHGFLTLNADGSFIYIPETDFAGPVSFTYRAYDGQDYSDPTVVQITVTSTPLTPTYLPFAIKDS